jgi:glycosyltransferase involved in cell wall biosynthesis
MDQLRILWFNWRCWLNPAMGGAEVFTHEVAKRCVATGHDITLFTSEFPDCKKEEVADGIAIVRAGGRFSVYRQAKKFYEKRFSKEGFDIIVDEINTVPFFAPKFVKNNTKVFALIHQLAREYWFYDTPFPANYLGYHFLEHRWLKNYKTVPTITVSESTQLDLISLGFKHIFVVPEGLNFAPLKDVPTKDLKPIVVFAGRLKRTKRPDHAIKAFELVKERMPEAELWILGDGPFRSKLERLAGESAHFFGHLSNIERQELIKRSWVLVNPGWVSLPWLMM